MKRQPDFDKPLPQARDAERAVVGACVYKPKLALPQVRDRLRSEHFLDRDCAIIYQHILDMADKGETIDTLTLRLRIQQHVDGNAGEALADTIHALSDEIGGDAANAGYYAKLVLEASVRREGIQVAAELFGAGHDGARDFSECLEDTQAKLASIQTTGRRTGPIITRLSDVEPEEIRWLWPGRFPFGKLSLLTGDPNLGKTFITLDIASRVSAGTVFPDEDRSTTRDPGDVILLTAEDGIADTIRPRVDALEGDSSRIHVLEGIQRADGEPGWLSLDRDIRHLEAAIVETDAKLVVIDPLSGYMGDRDTHKDSETRRTLGPLAAMAERTGTAIVGIMHLNKGTGAKAAYRNVGSIAFTASARAVWTVGEDPENEGRRVLVPVKLNLAEQPSGIGYIIEDGRVRWFDGEVHLTADEIMGDGRKRKPSPAVSDAADFIEDALSAGPMPSSDLFDKCADAGISKATARRAMDGLGVQPRKSDYDGKWLKVLPESAGILPDKKNMSTLGECEHLGHSAPENAGLFDRQNGDSERLDEGDQDAHCARGEETRRRPTGTDGGREVV